MKIEITALPTVFPVTAADLKAHSRVVDGAEDSYLNTFTIPAACSLVSRYLGRALMEITCEGYLRKFPFFCYDSFGNRHGSESIVLGFPPFLEMVTLKYKKLDATWQTLTENVDYIVDKFEKTIPELVLMPDKEWPDPDLVLDVPGAVCVQWKSGLVAGDVAKVDPAIKEAILLVCGFLYENREAALPVDLNELPSTFGVCGLLAPHKVY